MAGAPAEEKRHQRQKIKAECLFYLTPRAISALSITEYSADNKHYFTL